MGISAMRKYMRGGVGAPGGKVEVGEGVEGVEGDGGEGGGGGEDEKWRIAYVMMILGMRSRSTRGERKDRRLQTGRIPTRTMADSQTCEPMPEQRPHAHISCR